MENSWKAGVDQQFIESCEPMPVCSDAYAWPGLPRSCSCFTAGPANPAAAPVGVYRIVVLDDSVVDGAGDERRFGPSPRR